MIAGRFGVFLDFDVATVGKESLDVARVKLRTVRRGMIDTVLQLMVVGERFDVWVVEERCSCRSREADEEEGCRGSVRSNSNLGERGWQKDDGDLFSDGRTDSDRSESAQLLLDLQRKESDGSLEVTGEKVGGSAVDLLGQPFLKVTITEKEADFPTSKIHVEKVRGGGVEPTNEVLPSGGVVGTEVDLSFLLQQEERMLVEKEQPFVPVEVGSVSFKNGSLPWDVSGPFVGPCLNQEIPRDAAVDQFVLGLNLSTQPVSVSGPAEAQREVVENRCVDVADEGVIVREVTFDLSESSSFGVSSLPKGKSTKVRKSKKIISNGDRPPVQQGGYSLFPKLALLRRPTGRRSKEAKPSKSSSRSRRSGAPPQPNPLVSQPEQLGSSSAQRRIERPGIDLQVVLPLPPSGLIHLVDEEGVSVSDYGSASDGVDSTKIGDY
ncbi:hypothetical protein TSUD_64200 [Trifolium subterraneum]|uniref:Uncharacterized protein n=1 Tax=Trifolium subterraneum TaxID=3900 RepID=A0A2Z6N8B0_TRISU|nr:hypothetical protein TSUD_64200 [Trifolium subterraneum]